MTTTQAMRDAWGAPCASRKAVGATAAYKALDQVLHAFGYHPRSGVTGSYNCRRITGGTKYSLHAYIIGGIYTFWTGVRVTMALAVDINWDKNPYNSTRLITDMKQSMIDAVEAIRTLGGKQVWKWGGDWDGDNRRDDPPYDAMHFQLNVTPAELAKGINWKTVTTGAKPVPTPTPAPAPKPTNFMEFPIRLPELHIGMKGDAVTHLQQHLKWFCNQKQVEINGAYDEKTLEAVHAVKKFYNSINDGPDVPINDGVGPVVWEMILAASFGPQTVET